MKTHPNFEKTRRNNKEFGGRSMVSSIIMEMMYPQKQLADYNIAGPLNALLKPIQLMDTESPHGQRSILISKNPGLLHGFSLNRNYLFDSVVRVPLSYELNKSTGAARVNIPALTTDINLFIPGNHPFYSFSAVLGIIPDVYFDGIEYKPLQDYYHFGPNGTTSPWFPVQKGNPPFQLDIKLQPAAPTDTFTLLLTIGIRLGTPVDMDKVEQVKYGGSAKVLGVE
jgi:hypothetical protein